VCSKVRDDLPQAELVRAMMGRTLDQQAQPLEAPRPEVALRVRELTVEDPRRPGRMLLDGLDFQLLRGEILGVAGLQGSGAAELLHALAGDFPAERGGRIELYAAPLRARSPRAALESGVVLLPSDRALSVFGELGIADNATLSSLERVSRHGLVRRAWQRRAVGAIAERLALGPVLRRRRARELSGGNRQRLALARCLLARPRLLLLDEPTRGVDVAAKQDIYRFVRELAAEGVAVIWVASELDELSRLSHRVIVLSRGKQAGIFERDEAGSAALLRAAMSS
jgi:ABC-type sugar transport system ATPase subunit